MEVVGKATIGPLVAAFLEAIRTGHPRRASARPVRWSPDGEEAA